MKKIITNDNVREEQYRKYGKRFGKLILQERNQSLEVEMKIEIELEDDDKRPPALKPKLEQAMKA